jgi:hypothetical protein
MNSASSVLATAVVIAGVCGSLDERGLINGFDRKGFTYPRCGAELLANIYDARASQARVIVDRDTIRLIDNGIGMNEEKIQNMFSTFRENHINDYSMGVSGLGAKPSIYILSKKNEKPTTVYMYTHMDGCGYIKATIPFDKIKEEGRYTGMITYDIMNESEVARFLEERQDTNPVGTTIQWVYSETTHQYFEKQFSNASKKMDMNDRLCCIFGKTRLNIQYKDYESADFIPLDLYDYFSDERPEYYTGIKEDIIDHWVDSDNNDRFIWENDDKEYEFRFKAKGISKNLEEVKNKNGWTKEGFYVVKNAMRRDTKLFDELNPTCTQKITVDSKTRKETKTIIYGNFTASNELSEYEQHFFNGTTDDMKANIGKLHIVRNTQLVACIEMVDGFKISSSRASADANMKTILHKTELSYETKSYQDNRMDIAIGIQENKNQHSGDLPKSLIRMITHIKLLRYNEIIAYFQSKCDDKIREIAEQNRIREEQRLREEQERLREQQIREERLREERLREEQERLREEQERLREQQIREEQERLREELLREQQIREEQERLREEHIREEQERLREQQIREEQEQKPKEEPEYVNEEKEQEAKTRKISEATQTRITVQHGINILLKIKEENSASSEKLVRDMLISYFEYCAPDQIRLIIKYIPLDKRVDLLLDMINKQYPYNKEADMKEGAKLYKFVYNNE